MLQEVAGAKVFLGALKDQIPDYLAVNASDRGGIGHDFTPLDM